MPETVESCASCEVICAMSSGFRGSWFLSCVTSSVRKRSDALSVPFAAVVPLESPERSSPDAVVDWVESTAAMRILRLLAEREGLQEQVLRRVHDLHVRLVRARRGKHVDHLVDDADIRHRHVPL